MAEFGTLPDASRVTVPALAPDPLHAPFVKNVYATVPVGTMESTCPETVAVSYADAPGSSVPAHGAFVAASNTVVEVWEDAGFTVKGSQSLVAPR